MSLYSNAYCTKKIHQSGSLNFNKTCKMLRCNQKVSARRSEKKKRCITVHIYGNQFYRVLWEIPFSIVYFKHSTFLEVRYIERDNLYIHLSSVKSYFQADRNYIWPKRHPNPFILVYLLCQIHLSPTSHFR